MYTSWYHAQTNIIECLLKESKGPPGMLTERKMEIFCLDCGDYVKFSTLTKTSEHNDLMEERFILIHTSRNLSIGMVKQRGSHPIKEARKSKS